MKTRVTIDDVAKAAGVSKQTVSRAINNKGEIHPETKSRIMSLIDTMGYRPNRMAQAMSTQRSFMIGLVVPDITNPFFPEVARGVQDAALAHDYTALIVNTDEQEQTEIRLLRRLLDQGVDGLISFTHRISDQELAAFSDDFRPTVLINRAINHPNINLLLVDNKAGAIKAIDYLVNLGHKHIGMLSNTQFESGQVRRVKGYYEALKAHQLPHAPGYFREETPNLAGGYRATQTLLEAHPEITAIFCYNDLMGLGATRACIDSGRRVPEDISIIGFDDIRLASMNSPALTTLSVDKYEMGNLAFKRLLDLMNDPQLEPMTISMSVGLIPRESTGPAPS